MLKTTMFASILFFAATVRAQEEVPYRAPQNDRRVESSSALPPGPYAFLGCGKGAWWLNGYDGVVLHIHASQFVEHWGLVYFGRVGNWYYYYERDLNGPTEWKNFQWAIYLNPCTYQAKVYRQYPSDGYWKFVCCAQHVPLGKDARSKERSPSSPPVPPREE